MPKDVVDLVHNFMYYLGLRKERPYFGKFSYLQKFDYWAVYWGMFIIGTSGFFLGLPGDRVGPLPDLHPRVDLGRALHHAQRRGAPGHCVHLIIHFYMEHLLRRVPMNWLWLTGKMSVEKLKHHHPAEYDYLFGPNPRRRTNSHEEDRYTDAVAALFTVGCRQDLIGKAQQKKHGEEPSLSGRGLRMPSRASAAMTMSGMPREGKEVPPT